MSSAAKTINHTWAKRWNQLLIPLPHSSNRHLILDEKDIVLIKGKKVVIVDDVISTGSTLHALTTLIHMAGGDPDYKIATICTEGGEDDWPNVICLGHLPLFKD